MAWNWRSGKNRHESKSAPPLVALTGPGGPNWGARDGAALTQAAHSGELDFQRMADAILRDIARVAAEAVFNGGPSSSALNVNMNFAQGTEQSAVTGRNAIGAVLARLVSQGGRFL